jgi:hypothetical protein
MSNVLGRRGLHSFTRYVPRLHRGGGNVIPMTSAGRVYLCCGFSFETSPKPPASSDSVGREPFTSVFIPSLTLLGLSLNALSRLTPQCSTGILL